VKCFGGTNNEQSAEVLESKEGGYLFTGSAKSANGDINGAPADADMWVVKITNNGSIQWQSLIQILYTDVCRSVKQFPNNDYLVIGSIGKVSGSNQQEDIYITRFSQLGFILYQYGIGGSNQDIALSCQLTKDGGWIILGKTSSTNGNITQNKGGFDLWVTKMNPSGNIQWQKTYGGTNTEANNNVGTIQITENDDYIVTSSTRSNNGDVKPPITPWSATASRIWILKLNCVGTIQWQKLIGGDSEDNGISITQTTDKGFIAISNVSSNNGNISNNKGGQDVLFTKLAPDPFIKPTLTASGSLAICDDQMVTLDGNLGNGYTYQWQKNGSDLSGETSAAITVSASGTYKLIIKPSSCPKPIVDASATVAVTPKPSLVLPATLVFCKPPLTLAPNLIVGATYQWSTGQTTPNIEVSNAGIYQVNALLGGCNVSQSVVVTQQQPPLISITDRIEDCFSVSKPFFLDAGNDPANQYKWMPGNITTSDITITQAGTYQLTVTDANLCSTTKSITIMANCVSGIYVPSIFSPNNDNINDFFSVTTLDAIEVNLKIYNRWGELVFNTSTNNSWDGTYNNLPAPEQTYTWQLNYNKQEHFYWYDKKKNPLMLTLSIC
jgi:gliding motility-associated-like protein